MTSKAHTLVYDLSHPNGANGVTPFQFFDRILLKTWLVDITNRETAKRSKTFWVFRIEFVKPVESLTCSGEGNGRFYSDCIHQLYLVINILWCFDACVVMRIEDGKFSLFDFTHRDFVDGFGLAVFID